MDNHLTQNEDLFKSYLQRISNILIINGGFLGNPGLYTGEMGIVLFFFRYARFKQNMLYSDYCFDLIEKVQNRIHDEASIDYRVGITGIGCAFEYLVQNGFIETDTDDILAAFDERIFSTRNLPFLRFDELSGICYYAFWRISGKSAKKYTILNTFLPHVVYFMEKMNKNFESEPPAIAFFKQIVSRDNNFNFNDNTRKQSWYDLCRKNSPYRLGSEIYSRILEQFSKKDFLNKSDFNPGIQNGLAGLGLSLLSEIDGDDSWISLFPT